MSAIIIPTLELRKLKFRGLKLIKIKELEIMPGCKYKAHFLITNCTVSTVFCVLKYYQRLLTAASGLALTARPRNTPAKHNFIEYQHQTSPLSD